MIWFWKQADHWIALAKQWRNCLLSVITMNWNQCSLCRKLLIKGIIWNILWVNSLSICHNSYKTTNIPANIRSQTLLNLLISKTSSRAQMHGFECWQQYLYFTQRQIFVFVFKYISVSGNLMADRQLCSSLQSLSFWIGNWPFCGLQQPGVSPS